MGQKVSCCDVFKEFETCKRQNTASGLRAWPGFQILALSLPAGCPWESDSPSLNHREEAVGLKEVKRVRHAVPSDYQE